MFISIGSACNVKYQLDIIFGKKETLFFDWLMTDMQSVIEIFNNYDDINKLLYYNNIIQNPLNPVHNNKSRIVIKSLSYCESIHDIDIHITPQKIYDFIEKYKRRYERIINYIKDYNNKIYFIRHGEINCEYKNQFIKIIKKINPKCDFILASVIENISNDSIIEKTENYICINLNKFKKQVIRIDWKNEQYNWKSIFNVISNEQIIQYQPLINKPLINKPLINKPLINNPLINKPLINKPLINKPFINKPLINKLLINKAIDNSNNINLKFQQINLKNIKFYKK